MRWIHDYHLFLFDFDGLLVNTEEIHYRAYQIMCKGHGFDLPWDFHQFCKAAHYDSHGIRKQMRADLPELFAKEPNWDALYPQKKKAVAQLVEEGAVQLMPGVEGLLKALENSSIKRCVVTHSPKEMIHAIRKQNPILDTIPYWVTREDYTNPKPDPECYKKAIGWQGSSYDKIIGFEDTPRGIKAMMQTRARPVIVCQINYPELPDYDKQGVKRFKSLLELAQISDL